MRRFLPFALMALLLLGMPPVFAQGASAADSASAPAGAGCAGSHGAELVADVRGADSHRRIVEPLSAAGPAVGVPGAPWQLAEASNGPRPAARPTPTASPIYLRLCCLLC